MLIRTAVLSDTNALIGLMRQLGYDIGADDVTANLHLYEKMKGFVFVAEEETSVMAFISGIFVPLFHRRELMFRITALCVDEQQRGRGTGRALVQKIEALCRKNDCTYLEVTSGAHRKKDAHLFYESLGYANYRGKRFTKRMS